MATVISMKFISQKFLERLGILKVECISTAKVSSFRETAWIYVNMITLIIIVFCQYTDSVAYWLFGLNYTLPCAFVYYSYQCLSKLGFCILYLCFTKLPCIIQYNWKFMCNQILGKWSKSHINQTPLLDS